MKYFYLQNRYPAAIVIASNSVYILRIILINTPTYYMSKIFAKILKFSLPVPNSQVKNSFMFKDVISKTKIATDHIMISLDVMSLFTNVPFDLVLNSIKKIWCLIKSATNLPLQEFQKGIEFFGTPMGSPISPILADLVLQDLEEEVIKKLSFNIQAYYRYVDDTFLIIPKNKIIGILKIFNSYHSRLNSTYESEFDDSLSFLNLLMIKNDDGTIDTNWHIGRYLIYFSNHPLI